MDEDVAKTLLGLENIIANIKAGNITAKIVDADIHSDNNGCTMSVFMRGQIDVSLGGLNDSEAWKNYIKSKQKEHH